MVTLPGSPNGKRMALYAAGDGVAVLTLKSDRSMRDEKIQEIGLESSRYPTATFVISKPATIPPGILTCKVVHASITGVLKSTGSPSRRGCPLKRAAPDQPFRLSAR